MNSYFLRIGRLKGKSGLALALKHNKRQLVKQNLSIDSTRSTLNYSLVNDLTAAEITAFANKLKKDAGITKERKNGVVGIEVIFSLPAGNVNINSKLFFIDCFNWLKNEFDIPILSFDVHLDEAAKHAHAILLPLKNQKMCGSEVIGFLGKLNQRLESFFNKVGRVHGLTKVEKNNKSKLNKTIVYKKVISMLKSDPAAKSIVWESIKSSIQNDPFPFAAMLDLDVRNTKLPRKRSFVQIMTSKGKGPKSEVTTTMWTSPVSIDIS